MKNLHLLPTDKPTWLHKSTLTGVLRKSSSCIDDMKQAQGMNIYITSDEEIKEGEYQLYNPLGNFDNAKVSKAERLLQNDGRRKKIILTTDVDLIKDGVQAIDDEFLEWFVKNPSCESVEIHKEKQHIGEEIDESYPKVFFDYKIIILKEEAKQETLEKYIEREFQFNSSTVIQNQEYVYLMNKNRFKIAVNNILKYQKEQDKKMYSEEDMRKMYDLSCGKIGLSELHDQTENNQRFKDLLEQFKKK